jgi:hypothetical protein
VKTRNKNLPRTKHSRPYRRTASPQTQRTAARQQANRSLPLKRKKMTNEQNNKPLERIEEIINWTLPGMTMYYRDTNLSQEIIDKYETGKTFRSQTFVDVSNYAGKPTTNCRFIFASSKAAPLFRVSPATEKWGLHSINCNSYFKVLDVYKKENVTQISHYWTFLKKGGESPIFVFATT